MPDPTTPEAQGADVASTARPLSWRKRRPVLARSVLYGALAVVLGAGAWAAHLYRAHSYQQSLLTRVQALNQVAVTAERPEMMIEVLRGLREDVLPHASEVEVVREARFVEAAALSRLRRYEEAEGVYVQLAAAWPKELLRGTLCVPWASMRIDAGRPGDALTLLDGPGATEGWPSGGPTGAQAVRARAKAALGGPAAPSDAQPAGR